MRTETALRMVRDRDRLLAEVLGDERSQGMPEPFDWAAWRLKREKLVAEVRSATYWKAKLPSAQAVHRLGMKPSRS